MSWKEAQGWMDTFLRKGTYIGTLRIETENPKEEKMVKIFGSGGIKEYKVGKDYNSRLLNQIMIDSAK